MLRFLFTCYLSVLLPDVSWAAKGLMIHQPNIQSSQTNPSPLPATTSQDIAFLSPVFGLSKRLPSSLTVRGGDVLEPESADDVDSTLIRAGSENKLVVIDFTASWCGPCKMIAPLFKELSEEYSDVIFIKVDVDENPETAAKYGVSAMPTFVFIKAGEVIDRLMGANPARLQELIEEHK